MEGLEELENLEELLLSHNGISQIEGLEKNVSPTTELVHGHRPQRSL